MRPHIAFQFKYGTEGTHCIIPTIKTFRNNFAKHASLKFMGDNWFVGIKWFKEKHACFLIKLWV